GEPADLEHLADAVLEPAQCHRALGRTGALGRQQHDPQARAAHVVELRQVEQQPAPPAFDMAEQPLLELRRAAAVQATYRSDDPRTADSPPHDVHSPPPPTVFFLAPPLYIRPSPRGSLTVTRA